MELLYIWVEQYKNIINTGFNFSSEYNIAYNKDEKILMINQGNEESLNLYNEVFLNINGLIGKNGSGKSNLFSLLKSVFADGPHFMEHHYILVIKQSNGDLLIVDKVSYNTDEFIKIDASEIHHNLTKESRIFKDNVDLIFFSNSFSIHDEIIFNRGHYDASLSFMLHSESQNSNKFLIESFEKAINHFGYPNFPDENEENFNRNKHFLTKQTIPHGFIYSREMQYQLKFISKYIDNDFKFLPKQVDISFNALFVNNSESETIFRDINKYDSIINLIHERDVNAGNIILKREIFEENIILSIFLTIWKNQIFEETLNLNENDINTLIEECVNPSDIPGIIKNYILSGESIVPGDRFPNIQTFIQELSERIENINFLYSGYANRIVLEINEVLLSLLDDMFSFWYDSQFIFLFVWQGLSAGENALLAFFSRLNSISEIGYLKETIWLLIDEGELYLHPEWQRSFIHDLNTYLPKFFTNKKIQVILSSHSPFVVSDIPKKNIIWLDKTDEGVCKILNNDILPETFGANIHELLANSFFLKQGCLGKFSMELVQDLMNRIAYNDEFSDEANQHPLDNSVLRSFNRFEDIEAVKPYIELIGEPLIRQRLTEMFNEIEGTIFDKDIEIKRLKERISKLESDLE